MVWRQSPMHWPQPTDLTVAMWSKALQWQVHMLYAEEWIKQWTMKEIISKILNSKLFSKLGIIGDNYSSNEHANEPLLNHLTIMINVQRVSARTTRMHSFLIFNMDTTVGAIWPWKPSSIMLTSCFISSRTFSAKGSSPQVCYLGFLNGCHWTCLDCTAVFVSEVYLYEVFAPPHYSCMYPLVQGEGQEIDKKTHIDSSITSYSNFQMVHQYQL